MEPKPNWPTPEPGNRKQREDDVWIEQLAKRLYPELINRLCADMGINRGQLYQAIMAQVNRKQELHRIIITTAGVAAAIGALISALAAVLLANG